MGGRGGNCSSVGASKPWISPTVWLISGWDAECRIVLRERAHRDVCWKVSGFGGVMDS